MEQQNRRRGTAVVAVLVAAVALALGPRRLRRRRRRRQRRQRRQSTKAKGAVKATLTISNWPRLHRPGERTVAEFENETGVKVDYIEDVNDNEAFFGKMQPQLEQGESGGRSIFVVTDWMAKQMHDLGYLQEIDRDDLPNVFENLGPEPARTRRSTRTANTRSHGRAG